MPSALVTCKDGYATTVIQNILETELTLTITSPFVVTKYNPNECNVNKLDDSHDLEIDGILTENLT